MASPLVLGPLSLPFGYTMSFCAVLQTSPHFKAGVYWFSPSFAAATSDMPPALGCTLLPWLPTLSQHGAVLVP